MTEGEVDPAAPLPPVGGAGRVVVHPRPEDLRAAAMTEGVVDGDVDPLGQERQQQPEQDVPHLVHAPARTGQEAVERRVVTSAQTQRPSAQNSPADGVSSPAHDPAADQRDEVLEARRRKARGEAQEDGLDGRRKVCRLHGPTSVSRLV